MSVTMLILVAVQLYPGKQIKWRNTSSTSLKLLNTLKMKSSHYTHTHTHTNMIVYKNIIQLVHASWKSKISCIKSMVNLYENRV